MDRFPSELTDLLTPRGRRALAPVKPAADRLAGHALLERRLRRLLVPLERRIPPESIANQTRNHQERLVKVARQATAYLERRSSRAFRIAELRRATGDRLAAALAV